MSFPQGKEQQKEGVNPYISIYPMENSEGLTLANLAENVCFFWQTENCRVNPLHIRLESKKSTLKVKDSQVKCIIMSYSKSTDKSIQICIIMYHYKYVLSREYKYNPNVYRERKANVRKDKRAERSEKKYASGSTKKWPDVHI